MNIMPKSHLFWESVRGNLTKVDQGFRRGGWQGGSYHSMSITEGIVNYRLQQTKRYRTYCISYKKLTTSATQPMRNHQNPELLVFSKGLSFKTTPPNSFLLLHKIRFLSVGLTYGLAIACLSWITILLFLNKPTFADKIAFIFNVNTSQCIVPFPPPKGIKTQAFTSSARCYEIQRCSRGLIQVQKEIQIIYVYLFFCLH